MLLEFNQLFLTNNFGAQLALAKQAHRQVSELAARVAACWPPHTRR